MTFRLPIEQFDLNVGERGQKRSIELWVETGLGESVTLPVLQVTGTTSGPSLLILAGVHGDEYEGVETILRLYDSLNPNKVSGAVTLIPTANPLAYRGGTRTTPEDGLNMARVFPGDPEGAPTERLAFHLHHRFIAKASFLLDLHSGGTDYAVAALVGYNHNERTELGRKSRAAAEAFGSNLLWAHPEIAPGRTISSALQLGIPWLYTETYGGRRVRREDAELFLAGTVRLMRHLGMLQPEAAAEPLEQNEIVTVYSDGNFDASAVSEADGFFVPAVDLNALVKEGDRIGTIYGLNGLPLQEVLAGTSGLLVMIKGTPVVKKGEPLYMLAATEFNSSSTLF